MKRFESVANYETEKSIGIHDFESLISKLVRGEACLSSIKKEKEEFHNIFVSATEVINDEFELILDYNRGDYHKIKRDHNNLICDILSFGYDVIPEEDYEEFTSRI